MNEAKVLKLQIAKLTSRAPDLTDVQIYGNDNYYSIVIIIEEEVKRLYPSYTGPYNDEVFNANPPSSCCTTCSTF